MQLTDTQLTSLEEELRVLRIRLQSARRPARRTFASLQGLWRRRANFSLEAIRRSEIRPPLKS